MIYIVLGGLMVSVLATDPRFAGSNTAEGDEISRAIKSAARLHVERFYGMSKTLWSTKEKLCKANFMTSSASSYCFLLDNFVYKIARELWRTNQEFSRVEIIPTWFSILTFHLGYK
jgi:endo-1,4-beta-D-glucanase Y